MRKPDQTVPVASSNPLNRTRGRSRFRRRLSGTALLASLLGSLVAGSGRSSAEHGQPFDVSQEGGSRGQAEPVRFGRDVRPILSDRCFQCHGPDMASLQADLRLDSFEGATRDRDGSFAIVPGDPDSSEVIERVSSTRSGHVMPPPDSGKRGLSEAERDVLRRWIEQGASYEDHWAFQPPTRPPLPDTDAANDRRRNPIDEYIGAELAANGLTPSEPAAPIELFRRLFLEVTGMPPTLDEVARFEDELLGDDLTAGAEADELLDAWLERLLTTEPYLTRHAERMTRPWLDQARYADTSGIHMDAGRQAWAWRDWVIDAYRANKPFDEFVIEQIAGDLLQDPTIDQLIATGFNRNHVTTDEGGAISEEYLVEYAIDRVKTTGAVFLGMTVGCAQCHDHKFDPISMEEFYGLFAYYNSNDEPGLYSQQRDVNRAFEPFIEVPAEAQQERLEAIAVEVAAIEQQLQEWTPEEEAAWEAYRADLEQQVRWAPAQVVSATSVLGAELTPQDDGSVLVSGENNDNEEYTITLRTEGSDLRALLLEALPEDGAGGSGPIGRFPINGNAVIRSIFVEAVSVADPTQRTPVPLAWAHADFAQVDQDFSVLNVLEADNPRWWALGGHLVPGARAALLIAAEPFGYVGGTDLVVHIDQTSLWSQHTLARPRLTVGSISDEALGLLPTAFARFHQAGPFAFEDKAEGYASVRAPERSTRIDPDVEWPRDEANPEAGSWRWSFNASFVNDVVFDVPSNGRDVNYLGREVFAPTARSLELSLGSDDGFILLLNGERLATREVDRPPGIDQDRVTIELDAGRSVLIHGIVNTGGPSGAYFRGIEEAGVLSPDLVPLLYPVSARSSEFEQAARADWHRQRSPRVTALEAQLTALNEESAELQANLPLAMVMRELPEPRPTYILMRGAYDHPDTSRVIPRGIPAALGTLPDDAPANRLGLARWLVARDNPLTARVTVNRLWAQVFGAGLVTTTDDFGLQGAWPSHPELLDWLAVEFMDSGWDVQHMLRLMLTSATWRQSSHVRPEAAELDPEDALLSRYPRKRLSAEAIRDQALHASGLLVEKTGGPSVKPYQPEGIWQEVAMLSSNTRTFVRGTGDDLWRRSLYTYWKRAAPPPAMLTFDAPTREFCVVERATTDTPLQALVLLNDEQFLEAARMLAQRTLAELPASDFAATNSMRLESMFRRVLARAPEAEERDLLLEAFAELRWRYLTRGDDARELLEPGEAALLPEVPPLELAAWTLIASAILNLYETTNPR